MKVEFNVHLECRPIEPYFLKGSMAVVTKPKPVFDRDVEKLTLEIANMGRFTKSIGEASGKHTNVREGVMLTSHNISALEAQFRNVISKINPELKIHFKYGNGFVMVYTEDSNRKQKFSGTFDFGAVLCWLSQVLSWPIGAKLIPDRGAIVKHIADRADEAYVKLIPTLSKLGPGSVDLTYENMAEAFNNLYWEKGMPEFKVGEMDDGIYFAYYCAGDKRSNVVVRILREYDHLILAGDIYARQLAKENVD